MINPIDYGSIAVATIAAAGSWAARRASAKATTLNTNIASRFDVEKEAYVRARQFDTETIERQRQEIEELRTEVERLERKVDGLNARLNRRPR